MNRANPEANKVLFKLGIAINGDNSLGVRISEQKAFTDAPWAARFPFQSVVAGYHGHRANGGDNFTEEYKDTDSFQVAVQWLDGEGKDVAHETNAMPQEVRDVGARWRFTGDPGEQTATYTTDTRAPESAVTMNVVVLYTDAFMAHTDLSVIVGSVTATRKDADSPWTIVDNPKDIFGAGQGITRAESDRIRNRSKRLLEMEGDLAVTPELQRLQQTTQDVLRDRMGYEMKRRIDKQGGGLNAYTDTGYDIIIRE